jgi:hypothetical protein
MASKRVPAVLAVEIVTVWPTTIAVDCGHGCGESHVGRGTDCLGTAGEAWDSGLAAYGSAIHAGWSQIQELARLSGLGAPSCAIMLARCSVAILRHGDGDVPRGLHLGGLGGWHTPDSALERDRPSDGGVDDSAVSDVVPGDQSHRFVVHDHDSIYSESVDRTIAAIAVTVLKTPVRAP